jgi:hypothetical protein
LYIADNGTFRIIRRAPDGVLTLVAGTGRQAAPNAVPTEGAVAASVDIGVVSGVAFQRDGTLLFADSGRQRVMAVSLDGRVFTVAGGGEIDVESLSGTVVPVGTKATDLRFDGIGGLTVEPGQNTFVANQAGTVIARIVPGGGVALVLSTNSDAGATRGLAIGTFGRLIYTDGSVIWSVQN